MKASQDSLAASKRVALLEIVQKRMPREVERESITMPKVLPPLEICTQKNKYSRGQFSQLCSSQVATYCMETMEKINQLSQITQTD